MNFKIKLTEGMKINFLQSSLTIDIDTPASYAVKYNEADSELVFEKPKQVYPKLFESCQSLLMTHYLTASQSQDDHGIKGTIWIARYEKQCAALYKLLVAHEAYTLGYNMDTYETERWILRKNKHDDGYTPAKLSGSKCIFVFPNREACEQFIANFSNLLDDLRPLDRWVL